MTRRRNQARTKHRHLRVLNREIRMWQDDTNLPIEWQNGFCAGIRHAQQLIRKES
jgi:hypothetical protein